MSTINNMNTKDTMNSKDTMNFLNPDVKENVLNGKPFTFTLSNSNIISSIHRSPRGSDCWICEHQYGTEYTLSRVEDNFAFFNVKITHNNNYNNYLQNYGQKGITEKVFKNIQNEVTSEIKELYAETKWKINLLTGELHVYVTHLYGDKWAIYQPNEYSINIKILKL